MTVKLFIGPQPVDGQHQQPEAGTVWISTTGRAPPGHEKGPVSVACCRAPWTNRTDREPPLTEATGAASVRPVIDVPAASFPPCKAGATLAARLALIGFELRRAELGGGYVVARWDRGTEALADLAAVAAFADKEGAPS